MSAPQFFSRQNTTQFGAAIFSGLLLAGAFPKLGWDFLAWFALLPLLFVLLQENVNLRRACTLGFITGWIFFFASASWITNSMIRYGGMNIVLAYGAAALFTAITGIFPGVFALLTKFIIKRLGLSGVSFAPFIWTATEWARGIITNTTWNALGISQVDNYFIASLAQWGGVALVSFCLVAINFLLLLPLFFKNAAMKPALKFSPVFIGLLAVGILVSSDTTLVQNPIKVKKNTVEIAAIQPNLPVDILTHSDDILQRNVSGLETNIKLTRDAINQAEQKKADVIVWAESPLVLNYEQDETAKNKINELAKETKAHIIFSAIGRSNERVYNSVQTITPDGRALQRYDKIRLIPFGEYVPLRPLLGAFVPPMVGDFAVGEKIVTNTLKLNTALAIVQNEESKGEVAIERSTNFVKLGTFICYEAAYPNIVRQFVLNGAGVLVNVSDDAWFGNSAGAEQHLAHARMRAIENNRDIVRVTNSGISALITNQGKIAATLPSFSATSKIWTAETNRVVTFYTKHGDWFAYLCALVTALAILLSFVYHSRSQ